jgi:hypothetical protein
MAATFREYEVKKQMSDIKKTKLHLQNYSLSFHTEGTSRYAKEDLRQGCTNFPKLWEQPQNSRCQKIGMKQIQY